ncbi:serine hydrolase domain-containing protein [Streptomyces sp. NPDC051207]|uniref:serine hydrolase domain-containing protein n=1 Tax=Streptomyces sp. NPDC051207 TaxID=3154641 RepID=UPI00343D2BE8
MSASDLAALAEATPGATSITLAVLRNGQSEVFCHGHQSRTGQPTTPDTAYEMGSITKTFTALLLARLTAHGDVDPRAPLNSYLPRELRLRGPGGDRVVPLHLATHTSGLPALPPGLLRKALPKLTTNPYLPYTEEDLARSVHRTRLTHPPGTHFRYSNYGAALLGRALAHTTRTPYARLLDERICRPLGLTATHCRSDRAQAVGYNSGRPMPPWQIPALPAAGALRSTGNDLLRYLRAHLEPDDTPLPSALRAVQEAQLRLPRSGKQLCLMWYRHQVDGRSVFSHSGATRGFTTFIGFAPRSRTAFAALANTNASRATGFLQHAYTLLHTNA